MLDRFLIVTTISLIPIEFLFKQAFIALALLLVMALVGVYAVLTGRSLIYLLKVLLFFKVFTERFVATFSAVNYVYSVLFFFLLILFAIMNKEVYNKERVKNNLQIFAVFSIFIIMAFLTMQFGNSVVILPFARRLSAFLRYFTIFVLIFMIIAYMEPKIDLEMFVSKAVVLLSMLPIFLGLMHYVTHRDLVFSAERNAWRVASIFSHPNTFGFFCVIVVSQILVYLKYKDKWYIHLYLGVVMTVLVVGTQTRNAIAVALLLIIYGWAINWKRRMLLISGALYVLLFMQSYYMPLIESTKSDDITVSSTALREYVVQKVTDMYPIKYFIGYGLDTMSILVKNAVGGEELKAHNDYLKLTYETGLVSVIIYCLIYLTALLKIGANCITTLNKYILFSGKMCVFIILMLFLMMRYDNLIEQMILQYYIWTIIGTTIVLSSDRYLSNTIYANEIRVLKKKVSLEASK